jgi:hypothetical protein
MHKINLLCFDVDQLLRNLHERQKCRLNFPGFWLVTGRRDRQKREFDHAGYRTFGETRPPELLIKILVLIEQF